MKTSPSHQPAASGLANLAPDGVCESDSDQPVLQATGAGVKLLLIFGPSMEGLSEALERDYQVLCQKDSR